MEAVFTGNTKVDGKGRDISEYCLGLPTILRQILGHFSTKELLELSLVNKLWNFEARSVMRERGNVTARMLHGINDDEFQCQRLQEKMLKAINELMMRTPEKDAACAQDSGKLVEDTPCEKLEAFASDLKTMPVIPFSGIHLNMAHRHDCYAISKGRLDPSHAVILDLMACKRFSVYLNDSWRSCKDCPALMFVKHILEDYSGLLEDLTLGLGKEEFLGPFFQDRTFLRLKYLTFETIPRAAGNDSYTSSFIKELVSRAPNLQELRFCPIGTNLAVNVLDGSSAVIVAKDRFRPLHAPICEELSGSIRAEDLEICIHRAAHIDPGLLNSLIPKLLEASHTTLKTLSMDLFFAVPLMCYGICLENVTTLQLHANCNSLEKIEPSILALAKRFDFTRVFPRLKKVAIVEDYNNYPELSFRVVSAFVEQANAVMSRALPERAINIKLLDFQVERTLEDCTLPFLAQMFPDVKTVRTKGQLKEASFTDLRKHFLCLEEVIDSLDEALD